MAQGLVDSWMAEWIQQGVQQGVRHVARTRNSREIVIGFSKTLGHVRSKHRLKIIRI